MSLTKSQVAWRRFVSIRIPGTFIPRTVKIERERFDAELPPEEDFYELVYDIDAAQEIFERWPTAQFFDASDFIHEGRFEVIIPNTSKDEVYPWMIREGWSGACLGFGIRMHGDEDRADIRRWLDGAKALMDAENDVELSSECHTCPDPNVPGATAGAPYNECPKSLRPCGHHCNCSWVHDHCHWCGKEFGEVEE